MMRAVANDGRMAEFLELYQRCVAVKNLNEKAAKWFPRWFEAYVRHHRFHTKESVEQVPVTKELLILFLQNLRDKHVAAWQRLQAMEAIELYYHLVLRTNDLDFTPIRNKLSELAAAERRAGSSLDAETHVAGEGNPGLINEDEPKAIVDTRKRLRLLHHPISTERAYLGWLRRFMRHVGDEDPSRYGVEQVTEFLSELALLGQVAASTQNQALNALLFYFRMVVSKDLGAIDAVRARVSKYRPTVLTRSEVLELSKHLCGTPRLMFWLMYGAGLRHKECRTLRIKDVCLEELQIVVRECKGATDRVTVLPQHLREDLKHHIKRVKELHSHDL